MAMAMAMNTFSPMNRTQDDLRSLLMSGNASEIGKFSNEMSCHVLETATCQQRPNLLPLTLLMYDGSIVEQR